MVLAGTGSSTITSCALLWPELWTCALSCSSWPGTVSRTAAAVSFVLGFCSVGLLRTTSRTTLDPMTGTSNDEIAAWSVIGVPFSIVVATV